MKRPFLAALAATVSLLPLAIAQPPRVVSTEPADGARNVPLLVGRILVTFDRDMADGAWSFVRSPKGPPPPYAGQPRYLDPCNLVIPLGKLEPGVTYALSLNSESKQGFRSAEGAPLPPTELSFTAAGASAGPPRPPQPPPAPANAGPAGRWVQEGGEARVEQWFFADGQWGSVRMEGGKHTFHHGTWRAAGSALEISDEGGETLPPQQWERDAGGRLLLKRRPDDPRPRTLAPQPLAGPAEVAGTWFASWAEGSGRTWEFRPDGTFGCRLRFLGKELERNGSWRLSGLKLEVRGADGGEAEVYEWVLLAPDRLALTMERKNTLVYERQGGVRPPAPVVDQSLPPGLLGTWRRGTDQGEIVLELKADATFVHESRGGPDAGRSTGRWGMEKGDLILEPEGGRKITIAYRLQGPTTLVFTGEREFVWERVGGPLTVGPRPEPPRPPGPPVEPPRPPGSPLVGRWLASDETGQAEVVFGADGRYTRRLKSEEEDSRSQGTWKAQGNRLLVHDEEEGEELQVPFRLLDQDTLELELEGEKVVFRRAGTENRKPNLGQRPAELVGCWQAKDQTGEITLTLEAGGAFTLFTSDLQNRRTIKGEWGAGQGELLFQAEGKPPGRVPFRLTQEGLQANFGGDWVVLRRTGGGGGM